MSETLAPFLKNIQKQLGAKTILSIDKMQSVWSEYGTIYRLQLQGASVPSAVVKCIALQGNEIHPRGWATNRSHQRKLKSYLIENYWYENYAATLPDSVKVPRLLYSEHRSNAQVLVLEDLSISYPKLKKSCSFAEAKTVVKWLAHFHAHFINSDVQGLWPTGSYWHLDTRPEEWEAMKDSPLKDNSKKLDSLLTQAKYQTIIHGDAKVANFCFGNDDRVAAVDFQYVGKGIGVKDLAYFIGSCFTGDASAVHEDNLLDYYFEQIALSTSGLDSHEQAALEKEWRGLYAVAWADFNRFLMGWLPEHQKLHAHALAKNADALKYLADCKSR